MSRADAIAFVSPRFPEGATVGGAETLLKTLAGYARDAGRQVTFLATCARDHFTWKNVIEPGRRVVDGIPVQYFPVDDGRDVPAFLRAQTRICRGRSVDRATEACWLRNSVSSRPLLQHLREAGDAYDRVVIGPYLFSLCVSAAEACPGRAVLVPCLHDEPFAYLGAIRKLFDGAESVFFNATPERDLACRLFGRRIADMPIVGMGIPTFDADAGALAKAHGLTSPYLLYAGRREPMKGTPLLLDYLQAFRERQRRDVKLVLTGSGDISPPPALAPHILDLGFVSETAKREAMAGALAFCHPSVNESFGIVLLEAWMAGTAALVHGGSAVLTHHCRAANGGMWFRNYPEFESELLLMLDRPAWREAMAHTGRRYVQEHFAPEAVARRFLAALDS